MCLSESLLNRMEIGNVCFECYREKKKFGLNVNFEVI